MSVGDLMAGALIRAWCWSCCTSWQLFLAWWWPESSPAVPREELGGLAGIALFWRVLQALVAPLVLLLAVLGSTFAGIATPTESAAVGAVGSHRARRPARGRQPRWLILAGVVCALLLVVLTSTVDLRVGRSVTTIGQDVRSCWRSSAASASRRGLLDASSALHRTGTLAGHRMTSQDQRDGLHYRDRRSDLLARCSAASAATTWCRIF